MEDCFSLSPRDALVGIRIDKMIGKKTSGNKPSDLNLWFEDDQNDPNIVHVSVNGQEPQKLALEYIDITFGPVAYFICNCGRRVARMYLVSNSTELKCRLCHNLRYRLSTLNPNSVAGKAIYRLDRVNKLIETRENMSRIFYRGQYTKRMNRFLTLCNKVGLDSVVNDAKSLLEVVKSKEILTNPVD